MEQFRICCNTNVTSPSEIKTCDTGKWCNSNNEDINIGSIQTLIGSHKQVTFFERTKSLNNQDNIYIGNKPERYNKSMQNIIKIFPVLDKYRYVNIWKNCKM